MRLTWRRLCRRNTLHTTATCRGGWPYACGRGPAPGAACACSKKRMSAPPTHPPPTNSRCHCGEPLAMILIPPPHQCSIALVLTPLDDKNLRLAAQVRACQAIHILFWTTPLLQQRVSLASNLTLSTCRRARTAGWRHRCRVLRHGHDALDGGRADCHPQGRCGVPDPCSSLPVDLTTVVWG